MFYPAYTIITNKRTITLRGASKFRAIENAQLAEDEVVVSVVRTTPKVECNG